MKKICLAAILVLVLGQGSVKAAVAGPLVKLTPASGSYTNGSTFTVTVGVDSGVSKSMAVDTFLTFDPAKLEVVSIEAAAQPAFSFTLGKNIYNTDGRFDMSFNPSGDAILAEAVAIKGDLAVVTLRAKSTGTAEVKFTCTAGSTIDTNIFDNQGVDVIDCASNINGVYTISAGDSTSPTATTAPQATVTPASSGELPKTGGVATTVGLAIFGIVGLLAGSILRWL